MTNTYCTRTDLTFIKSDIGNYDNKAIVQNWVLNSGSIYKSANVGQAVSMVYRDGLELGSPQLSSSLTSDGEWYYDESADILWLYSTLTPKTSHVIEIGRDVKTLQEESIKRASDFIRAYVNKAIMPRKGTDQADATGGDYEEIISRSCAILSVSYLISTVNPEMGDYYAKQVIDTETGMGYLDRIKRGEIKLWNEATERMGEGVVAVISQDATSTGAIVDTRGQANVPFDNILVKVDTGGTFEVGSSSTVTVNSYISNADGLQTQLFASGEKMDGSYLNIGRGISVRFSPGVYVSGDSWGVEAIGDFVTSGSIKNAQAYRG